MQICPKSCIPNVSVKVVRYNSCYSPANERLPSGVNLWLLIVRLLNWCSTEPTVIG